MEQTYLEFLKKKIKVAEKYGFEYDRNLLPDLLFEHQKDIIIWALSGGRCAIFVSFGLGKTMMQLVIGDIISKRENKPFFFGVPLGVKQEFAKDAAKLGLKITYVKDQSEVKPNEYGLYMSNYERIREAKFDPEMFAGVCFDEASVIRSMGTQTTQYILTNFKKLNYRFVFTATPSPNEYHELLKYSEFLGIMDIGQALNRYFKRDSVKAHNSSLLEHREQDFWIWVSSWAVFVTKPSDLGYSDVGYDMPNMKVFFHEVINNDRGDIIEENQFKLFADSAKSLTQASKEKRSSLNSRVQKAKEIVNEHPNDHYILWHHQEKERELLEKTFDCVSVYGSQKQEIKEKYLIEFAEGKHQILATKPEIAGSGCNFQYHCHKAIFLGIDYKFNDFIQAIHRIHRFMQKEVVEIHIIYTDAENTIKKALELKWERHKNLVLQMTNIIKENGLSEINVMSDIKRQLGVNRKVYKSEKSLLINNDSIAELSDPESEIKDNSVDLIVTSIPFSDLFEYAENYADMGQSNGDEEFFKHMDFLTPQLLRVIEPGRIACIHVKDCIKYSYQNGVGFVSLNDFSGKTVQHFQKHGWWLMGKITVTTDVVKENNQTYRLGWSEQCKDGSKMGVGLPEYILIFRKCPSDTSNGYADNPIVKSKEDYTRAQWQLDAHAYWKSNSEKLSDLPISDLMHAWKAIDSVGEYSYKRHVELSIELDRKDKLSTNFMTLAPQSNSEYVWTDIIRMHTLNTSQAVQNKIKHVCPLQLDIIERLIERYSMEGETVLDPFGGIMSVPYVAVKMKRKAIGIELNQNYWKDGIFNVKSEEDKDFQMTLF